jgi:hypothetical protein
MPESSDPVCRICGEKKSAHVATEKGPYTHPREARGEGVYRLKSAGTSGMGPGHDDLPYEHWEFVPHVEPKPEPVPPGAHA